MLELIILAVVAVVVYHWVDKENFYGALVASKDTAKYTAITTKEVAIVAKKGFQTSKAVYNTEVKEHEVAYARAGTTYEAEQFKRDRATVTSIKSVFKPANDVLDEAKAKADKRLAELDKELEELLNN